MAELCCAVTRPKRCLDWANQPDACILRDSLNINQTVSKAEGPMLQSCVPKNVKLHPVIDRLWCVSDMAADGFETVLPSGKAQIIFSLSDIPLAIHDPDGGDQDLGAHQILQGPTSRPRRISRKPQIALCGVSFCPGGAGALFGRIDETADRVIDLGRFWGEEAVKLGERLRTLNSDPARFDLLENEIGRRISDVPEIMLLGQAIELLRTGLGVDRVCEALDCSPYVFRKLFLRNVGFTPKRYLGIERFRNAADRLTPAASLAGVASDTRFSDQSHMTREMDRFARMTPRRMRSSTRPYLGHILDD